MNAGAGGRQKRPQVGWAVGLGEADGEGLAQAAPVEGGTDPVGAGDVGVGPDGERVAGDASAGVGAAIVVGGDGGDLGWEAGRVGGADDGVGGFSFEAEGAQDEAAWRQTSLGGGAGELAAAGAIGAADQRVQVVRGAGRLELGGEAGLEAGGLGGLGWPVVERVATRKRRAAGRSRVMGWWGGGRGGRWRRRWRAGGCSRRRGLVVRG